MMAHAGGAHSFPVHCQGSWRQEDAEVQPGGVQHVLCSDQDRPWVLSDDASNNIAVFGFSVLILCVILQSSSLQIRLCRVAPQTWQDRLR